MTQLLKTAPIVPMGHEKVQKIRVLFIPISLSWLVILSILLGCFLSLWGGGAWAKKSEYPDTSALSGLRIIYNAQGENKPLLIPDFQTEIPDIGGVRSKRHKAPDSKEQDPKTKELALWTGVVASDYVDRALLSVSLDQRAVVDLIIFKEKGGNQVLMPRDFLNRYPVLIATHKNQKKLTDFIPLIYPLHSKSKIQSELFPVEVFPVSDLAEVELTSFRNHFEKILLKKQTDPAAVRGEKLFLQNCLNCHASGKGPNLNDLFWGGKLKALETKDHPEGLGVRKLDKRDKRALINYLLTHEFERRDK